MTSLELWKTIIALEGHTFHTVRGIPFTYSVSRSPSNGGRHYEGPGVDGFGNELFITTNPGTPDEKKRAKSISRSTVDIAYKLMTEQQITGPRALGLAGSRSYLFPLIRCILNSAPSLSAAPASTTVEKEMAEEDISEDDDFSLTPDQIDYIKSQQQKADTLVSDPSSEFYEPNPFNRPTAARILMRERAKEHKL